MERFEHGGDIYAHPGAIDFSASLNPRGIPARVREVLKEGVDAYAAYPDPHCRELTRAIAAYEGVDSSYVLATAGATDAIARLCQALRPRRALLMAPCYAGYEQALEQVGCAVTRHCLRREDCFDVTEAALERITPDIDVVFLANPNNPTGRGLDRALLLACLEKAQAVGCALALDECFIDLTERAGSTDLVAHHPQLVIIKACTKTFALAGVRLGYALCSDGQLLARMNRAGQPWAVSVPAQLAGTACLSEHDYLAKSRALIRGERARLGAALAECGLDVIESQTNYLLFQGPTSLEELLLQRGVLVRSCSNFFGLDATWYRIAVRTPPENDQLIAALREVCG